MGTPASAEVPLQQPQQPLTQNTPKPQTLHPKPDNPKPPPPTSPSPPWSLPRFTRSRKRWKSLRLDSKVRSARPAEDLGDSRFAFRGLGLGVWGLGFGVWGLGFGVWGLGFRV